MGVNEGSLPDGMARCESCAEARHDAELVVCVDCERTYGLRGKPLYCKDACATKCASCDSYVCESCIRGVECYGCSGPTDAELHASQGDGGGYYSSDRMAALQREIL